SILYDKSSLLGNAPRISSISAKIGNKLAQTEQGSFAIKFKNFSKCIQSDGSKKLGFSLRDKTGNKCMSIYKAWIHDDMVILQSELQNKDLQKWKLYYGYGLTPLCNLSDGNDQGLLASGPHELPKTN
ncbi:MAG: hypothetical protein HRU15_02950, partial [Planctomycetes bacterium]|nr:hypothetical protein [Planctomycetota bacterium]